MGRTERYSETVRLADYGIRLAILDDDGRVAHLNNLPPHASGGFPPAVGDALTTLWDRRKRDPIDHYVVLRRYYNGKLKGQDCSWLLLEAQKP